MTVDVAERAFVRASARRDMASEKLEWFALPGLESISSCYPFFFFFFFFFFSFCGFTEHTGSYTVIFPTLRTCEGHLGTRHRPV